LNDHVSLFKESFRAVIFHKAKRKQIGNLNTLFVVNLIKMQLIYILPVY